MQPSPPSSPEADLKPLAEALVSLGCPPDKSLEMAAQLNKRAQQLMEQKNKTYEEVVAHLLGLMQQGWAAKERGNHPHSL